MKEQETRSEVERGIAQVDPNATIDKFEYNFDSKTRKSSVRVTIKLQDGETAEIKSTWG